MLRVDGRKGLKFRQWNLGVEQLLIAGILLTGTIYVGCSPISILCLHGPRKVEVAGIRCCSWYEQQGRKRTWKRKMKIRPNWVDVFHFVESETKVSDGAAVIYDQNFEDQFPSTFILCTIRRLCTCLVLVNP